MFEHIPAGIIPASKGPLEWGEALASGDALPWPVRPHRSNGYLVDLPGGVTMHLGMKCLCQYTFEVRMHLDTVDRQQDSYVYVQMLRTGSARDQIADLFVYGVESLFETRTDLEEYVERLRDTREECLRFADKIRDSSSIEKEVVLRPGCYYREVPYNAGRFDLVVDFIRNPSEWCYLRPPWGSRDKTKEEAERLLREHAEGLDVTRLVNQGKLRQIRVMLEGIAPEFPMIKAVSDEARRTEDAWVCHNNEVAAEDRRRNPGFSTMSDLIRWHPS